MYIHNASARIIFSKRQPVGLQHVSSKQKQTKPVTEMSSRAAKFEKELMDTWK
jgi:hypothetical protein